MKQIPLKNFLTRRIFFNIMSLDPHDAKGCVALAQNMNKAFSEGKLNKKNSVFAFENLPHSNSAPLVNLCQNYGIECNPLHEKKFLPHFKGKMEKLLYGTSENRLRDIIHGVEDLAFTPENNNLFATLLVGRSHVAFVANNAQSHFKNKADVKISSLILLSSPSAVEDEAPLVTVKTQSEMLAETLDKDLKGLSAKYETQLLAVADGSFSSALEKTIREGVSFIERPLQMPLKYFVDYQKKYLADGKDLTPKIPVLFYRITSFEQMYGASQEKISDSISLAQKKYDAKKFPPLLEEKEISLLPTTPKPIFDKISINETRNDLDGIKITSENISDVIRIGEDITTILRSPELVFKYLKNLDATLGQRLNNISFNNSPQYLIAGLGNFIPGPWPQGYKPLHKGDALNKELLAKENQQGINIEGVAIFSNILSDNDASNCVKDGNIFSEPEQLSRVLFHGKYSHRLVFEIIREAVKAGELNLEIGGQKITEKQLLKMMVATTPLIWDESMDVLTDTLTIVGENIAATREDLLNPDQYSSSCRSPFNLKSLITCFGQKELPNLCGYLLDSHYKQVAQMIYRLREADKDGSLTNIPDEFLYHHCMITMSTGKDPHPGFGAQFPFAESNDDILEKTQPFNERYVKGIRRENEPPRASATPARYDSFLEYISEVKDSGRKM